MEKKKYKLDLSHIEGVRKLDCVFLFVLALFLTNAVLKSGILLCVALSFLVAAFVYNLMDYKIPGVILSVIFALVWAVFLGTVLPIARLSGGAFVVQILSYIVLFMLFLWLHIRITDGKPKIRKVSASDRYYYNKLGVSEITFIGDEMWGKYEAAKKRRDEVVQAANAFFQVSGDLELQSMILSAETSTIPILQREKERCWCSNIGLNPSDYTEFLDSINILINIGMQLENKINRMTEEAENKAKGTAKTGQDSNEELVKMFFAGCDDADSIKKRYHKLLAEFHPDNQNGSTEMTQKLQEAYEKALQRV